MTPTVFVQTLQRALRYRVLQFESLQRIAWFCMSQGEEQRFEVDVDDSYQERPAYQEGCLTDEPDLSAYDGMLDRDDETNASEDESESEEDHA